MYEYFYDYYKANNMGLILTGNFDPEEVKPIIEAKFGVLEGGDIPENKIAEPFKFDGRQVMNKRLTPIKVGLMGFRTVPAGHPDELVLDVANSLLQNESGTGFVDQLQNDGKIMMAWSFAENMDEAGNQYFIYVPKILIQSLKGAEKLMIEQVEKLKTGNYSDDLLLSIKNEMYKNHQLSTDNQINRGYLFANMFRRGKTYKDIADYPNRLKKVSKEDIKRVCEKYFGKDYFVLQSRTGFPKKEKLENPKFKPVQVDQIKESEYAKAFKEIPENKLKDRFIDFNKDLTEIDLKGNKLYVVKNPINDIYDLTIQYHYGEFSDPDLEILADLMSYAHPENQSLVEFKKEISLLGSNYYFESTSNSFQLHITGIEKNLDQIIKKLNAVVQNPYVDEKSFDILAKSIKTGRKAEKEEPMVIAQALAQYGLFGDKSLVKNRSTAKEISKMNYKDVLGKLQEVKKHRVSIHFTGLTKSEEIKELVESYYTLERNAPSLMPYKTPLV